MGRAMKAPRSVVVYRGPSRYDAKARIRAVLTMHSANVKTGDMVQLFILHDKTAPHEAIKTGQDQAVCGSCPFRPALDGGCYVLTFQGPLSVWKSTRGRRVTPLSKVVPLLEGRALRLGAYGDVAALPEALVSALVAAVKGRVTGYTHGHRLLGMEGVAHLRTSCMLSVESEDDARAAWALGWRTFRGRPENGAPIPGAEIDCPADYRDVQCVKCGLCKGASLQARSIAIPVHGFAEKRALRVVSAA
jgi:hypothetical protein